MRSSRILRPSSMLTAGVVSFLFLIPSHARAEKEPPPPQQQCRNVSIKELEEKAAHAVKSGRLVGKFAVWPGGKTMEVELDDIASADVVYCAGFAGTAEQKIPVLLRQKGEETTTLALVLPDVGVGWWQQKRFVLVSFPVKDGKLDKDVPGLAVVETVRISNWRFSFLMAVAASGVAYWLAVVGLGKKKGTFSWSPVYLTSDRFDKASLSRFQLLSFTLLIAGLLVFGLARVGLLSDISEHLLWLLGISAGGTAGTKVVEEMKQRLSFENWSWLRNQEWLTAHEEGFSDEPNPHHSRWGDLLKATDGSLDIYSFQLALFSAILFFALLRLVFMDDIRELATFAIPQNLLALLGLSNGVYIGGKTVAPKSWEELDRKVSEVRQAEKDWIGKAMPTTMAQATLPDTLNAAMQAAPGEYGVYITRAREAARMLKALFGAEGTKFTTDPIKDCDLTPRFPVTRCGPESPS